MLAAMDDDHNLFIWINIKQIENVYFICFITHTEKINVNLIGNWDYYLCCLDRRVSVYLVCYTSRCSHIAS